MMPSKVVEQAGGREALIKGARQSMDAMKQQGITVTKSTVGTPEELFQADKTLYCLVPQSLEMNVATPGMEGTLQTSSFLLAMSSDDGKTWKFLDAAPGEKQIRTLFPDVPQQLKIPAREQPKFTPKEKK